MMGTKAALLLAAVALGHAAAAQPNCAGSWTGSWQDTKRAANPSAGTVSTARCRGRSLLLPRACCY